MPNTINYYLDKETGKIRPVILYDTMFVEQHGQKDEYCVVRFDDIPTQDKAQPPILLPAKDVFATEQEAKDAFRGYDDEHIRKCVKFVTDMILNDRGRPDGVTNALRFYHALTSRMNLVREHLAHEVVPESEAAGIARRICEAIWDNDPVAVIEALCDESIYETMARKRLIPDELMLPKRKEGDRG